MPFGFSVYSTPATTRKHQPAPAAITTQLSIKEKKRNKKGAQQMQSVATIQQAHAPTEPIQQFTADLQRAHHDALQILHRMMLQAAECLTKPPEEEASLANTVTQRMRLCFQMAREILRVRAPGDPSPTRARQPRTHTAPDDEPREAPPAKAAELVAAAGTAPTHTTQHTESPSDTLPDTSNTPASTYTPQRIPAELSHLERLQYIQADRGRNTFPLPLYIRLVEWYHYAQATGERAPFNTSLETLKKRRPPNGPDPQRPPISEPLHATG